MGSVLSNTLSRLASVYQPIIARYQETGSFAMPQRTALLVALIAVGLIVVIFAVVIALLPSKRKVVRKRRVRRTTRVVAAASGAGAAGDGATQAEGQSQAAATRGRRPVGLVITTAILLVAAVAAFVATYEYTGSNEYCGQSCHVTDPHVLLALKTHHAKCIDCHEADPISGMAARVRMAVSKSPESGRVVVSVPIDPAQCLRCHQVIAATTVTTATGLRISHKEILAQGYTCSDCHHDIGHTKTGTLTAGMGQCMSCHNGVRAPKSCTTCHTTGSPITVASAATKAASLFDYGTVRVANQDCARCHGAEKECIACHGLVLPHSAAFVYGGHARVAAFSGKQMCFKCHSLTWCGNGTCHGNFTHPASWLKEHQTGTSARCGSCHVSWLKNPVPADFCKVCH